MFLVLFQQQHLENNEQGTQIYEDKMKSALGLFIIQKLTHIKHERDNKKSLSLNCTDKSKL